ncbi:hypothetical protein D3C87_1271850 [compost metagenome]
MQLTEDACLTQAIRHVAVDLRQRTGGNFVLVLGVRAHGGDVQAGLQMTYIDQRLAARRAGDRDVDISHGLVDVCARFDCQAAVASQFDTEGLRLGRVPRPDPHAVDRPHQTQGLQLQRGLLTGTDQRDTAAVFPRQRSRRHGTRRRCTHGGQITVIQQ